MKRILFAFAILCALQANAQNYLITFAGTGLSTSVSSVSVENLTTGATLTINGGDILHLTAIITDLNSIDDNHSSELRIYPNPMADYSILQVYPPAAGDAVITVYDMTGKHMAHFQCYMENFRQDFKLSGIKSGFYIINVEGNSYHFSEKLLSNGNSNGTISIVKLNNIIQAVDEKTAKTDNKGLQATVDMAYTIGDRLKFTGISGIYGTVITDIPTGDKTITFNFIACSDGDDNNYPVVQIGTQLWMAENLRTTKYNDNTSIPLVTNNTGWKDLITSGYCWYNNDAATYKAAYGALYNWYVLDGASNGGKNVCPTGWHVLEHGEWTILTTYLGGEAVAGGKLKETGTTHWNSPNIATNESGYTALPGGYRDNIGAFSRVGIESQWWSRSGYLSTNAWSHSCENYHSSTGGAQSVKIDGFSVRCLKDNLSTLTTTAASSIKSTTAISGGNITNNGWSTVTSQGICWSISHNPTTADSKTIINGTGIGAFTGLMTGLTAGTTYYVRAYATNGAGTAYGDEQTFSTTLTVTDADGNIYNTIIIGTQSWMAENLKTTKYNDGTSIPLVIDNTEWAASSTPGYCWYNNDAASNKTTYGAIYNWYTVNTGKLCPAGWHVPTDEQWSALTTYLGGEAVAGGKLKEAGTNHWHSSDVGATNETGFTALPGGQRSTNGQFYGAGDFGGLLSATEYDATNAWFSYLLAGYSNSYINKVDKKYGYSIRCLQGAGLAGITTIDLSSITNTTGTCGGNISTDCGASITARGVCWSPTANPTIANNKTADGVGTGAFTSSITGLTPNTKYYIRAYATNSIGTAYGNEISFKTYRSDAIVDIDGNFYNIVTIGTQVWMAENLKTTKYNDGTEIPLVTDNSAWAALSAPGYCWYNNDAAANKDTYGALYNWYTVNTGKLCPSGWHVPTNAEWTVLSTFLGGEEYAACPLKETGTSHWQSPNTCATNQTGFTALPGGSRDEGVYSTMGNIGFWWTFTEFDLANVWFRYIFNDDYKLSSNYCPKFYGLSVRCLKD